MFRDLKLSTNSSKNEATEEEKAQWKQLCLSYVFGEGEVARYKPVKLKRVAAFDFGVALDNVLLSCAGEGLKQYYSDPEEPRTADKATLTLAMDQGSIGMSWTWYAINRPRLRILPFWDPTHRMWNDVRSALSASGNWSFVLLQTVLLNCFLGPWCGSACGSAWCDGDGDGDDDDDDDDACSLNAVFEAVFRSEL